MKAGVILILLVVAAIVYLVTAKSTAPSRPDSATAFPVATQSRVTAAPAPAVGTSSAAASAYPAVRAPAVATAGAPPPPSVVSKAPPPPAATSGTPQAGTPVVPLAPAAGIVHDLNGAADYATGYTTLKIKKSSQAKINRISADHNRKLEEALRQ